jgi:hypothetical protein
MRADEKAKADRDDALENKFAPPPPPRDGTPAPRIMKEGADKAPAPREEARAPVADLPKSVAPSRKAAPAQALGNLDDLLGGESGRRAGGGSVNGKGALGGLAGPSSKSDGAGAGAAQAAPRAATSESRSAPVAAPAPSAAPTAPAPPAALAKSRAKSSHEIADESYEAAAEAAPAKDEKKAAARNSTNETILLRADRLFAEGRWAEAAALYRELLRRDPRNDDAERWRRRLVAAENAEITAQRNANLAAKRAAPAQDKAEAESAARAGKQQQQPAAKPAKASKAAAADVAQ